MNNEQFVTWARWISILPAALAAYIGVAAAALLIYMATNNEWLLGFVVAAINPYLFVLVGAATAPRHRFKVAVNLAYVHTLFATILLSLPSPGESEKQLVIYPPWWDYVGWAISIAVVVVACFQVREFHQESAHQPESASATRP